MKKKDAVVAGWLGALAVTLALPWAVWAGESAGKPELVVQTGHTSKVASVAFSPDGKTILTGSFDNTAVLWDARSGDKLRTLKHTNAVGSVAFSPDGKTILTGSGLTAVLWDARSGAKLRTLQGHTRLVYSVAFSPDGKTILTGSRDNTAVLWDARSGDKLRTLQGHTWDVTLVAFSPDGQTILTSSWDKTAVLWDARSGAKLRTLQGHPAGFSPDGKTILTGSLDNTAVLWDARNGDKLRTLQEHTSRVTLVAFSADGKTMLTGSLDNTAVLWDARSGAKLRTLQGHTESVTLVAFSPDGKTLLTGSYGSTAELWDARSGAKLRTLQGHTWPVNSVAFSPDGKTLLTGSDDRTAVLWDAHSGDKLRTLQGHTNWVNSVAFSPDGKTLLTGSKDTTAELWDARSGAKLRTLQGHTWPVNSVAFSPDGKTILTGCEGARAVLWDANSGAKLRTLQGHGAEFGATDAVTSVAFSPDGKTLLTGSADRTADGVRPTAVLWDARSGDKLRTLQGHTASVTLVAFSPDGKTLLTGSHYDRTAVLCDAGSGAKLHALQGHTGTVWSVAFSPDGKTLLTGSDDTTAVLWDARSGDKLRTLQHTERVTSVAFSPDGKTILTGCDDETAVLWDARSGAKLRTLQGHTNSVTSVAFSPDGKTILTGSRDGTTRLWETASGCELARLLSLDGGRDWLVCTPEGLFDGSRGGREKVFYRIGTGLEVVPLDRFFQNFYYSGLLAEIWRGERPLPGKPLPSNPAPSLKVLLDSQPGVGARPEQVSIDVAVTDLGGGIKGPWLQHNRATLRNGVHVKTEGKTVLYRFPVSLVPGDNRIEVRAATEDGGRESDAASLSIPFNGKLPEPELYVIAIGINRHAKGSGVTDLDCCVADSKAIVKLFQERAAKQYREVHVTPLQDEQATKAGILQAIRDCASKAKPQDTLVVSISGHGVALGQRFYLIPHDFKLAQPQQPSETPRPTVSGVGLRGYREVTNEQEAAVRARGLAIDELGEVLAEVPALKRVLLFGTCHSGSAIQLASKHHNPFAFRGAVERFSRAQGVYSLSASKADELAAETKDLGHSLLTYALLAAVRAADSGPLKDKPLAGPQDSAVDVLRWFEYARTQVPGLYKQYVGRPQQIEISGDDQPTFPLFSRNPR